MASYQANEMPTSLVSSPIPSTQLRLKRNALVAPNAEFVIGTKVASRGLECVRTSRLPHSSFRCRNCHSAPHLSLRRRICHSGPLSSFRRRPESRETGRGNVARPKATQGEGLVPRSLQTHHQPWSRATVWKARKPAPQSSLRPPISPSGRFKARLVRRRSLTRMPGGLDSGLRRSDLGRLVLSFRPPISLRGSSKARLVG